MSSLHKDMKDNWINEDKQAITVCGGLFFVYFYAMERLELIPETVIRKMLIRQH